MLRRLISKRRVRVSNGTLATAFAIVCAGVAIAFVVMGGGSKITSLADHASAIIDACATAPYRPSCYEREIPRLMDSISMEEAFALVRLVQEQDSTLLHCHTLGHLISGRQVAKDPKEWRSVISRCPVNQCNNGCLHGVLIARYSQEYLNPDQLAAAKDEFSSICQPREEWARPSEADRAICYHGLGHLFMYATRADIPSSLGLCDYVTADTPGYAPSCSQAVFMSVFQPVDPEGEALVAGIIPQKDERDSFCSPYEGVHFQSCMNESWILFDEILQPQGLANFCSYQEGNPSAQQSCYSVGFNKMAIEVLLKEPRVEEYARYCEGLPPEWVSFCFTEGASNVLEADRANISIAYDVCSHAPNRNSCVEVMSSYYPKTYLGEGTNEYREYCADLARQSEISCQEL